MASNKGKALGVLVRLTVFLGLAAAVFFAGPGMIHDHYRKSTSATDRELYLVRHRDLVAFEAAAIEPGRTNFRDERVKVEYWFGSRGWQLDADGGAPVVERRLREWRDLFGHWGLIAPGQADGD